MKAKADFERSGIPLRAISKTDSRPQIEWGLRLAGESHWVNFEIIGVASWNLDGSVAEWGRGGEPARGDVPFEKAEPVLSGFVKWDGCTEVRFGDRESGQEHFCSAAEDATEIGTVWQWALRKAHQMMLRLGGHPDWEPVGEALPYFEVERMGDGRPCTFVRLVTAQPAERLLVWWTSQAEHSAIDEVSRLALPLYLQREVASRAGRAGHGRLWVPSEIEQLAAEPIRVADGWQTPLGLHIEEFCSGIVFSSKDLGHLAQLPGVVTDLQLRKVGFDV
jgi:hypothetical protein